MAIRVNQLHAGGARGRSYLVGCITSIRSSCLNKHSPPFTLTPQESRHDPDPCLLGVGGGGGGDWLVRVSSSFLTLEVERGHSSNLGNTKIRRSPAYRIGKNPKHKSTA